MVGVSTTCGDNSTTIEDETHIHVINLKMDMPQYVCGMRRQYVVQRIYDDERINTNKKKKHKNSVLDGVSMTGTSN